MRENVGLHIVRVSENERNKFPVPTPEGVVSKQEFREFVNAENAKRSPTGDRFVALDGDNNPIG